MNTIEPSAPLKLTPGPWTLHGCGVHGNSGYFHASIANSQGNEMFSFRQHVMGTDYQTLKGNAELVAIAPELLDLALLVCAMQKEQESKLLRHPIDNTLGQLYANARAVLSKIGGAL